MPTRWRAILASCLFAHCLGAQAPKVDFARDIQPILREHCYECHGSSQQMRGLRLDRRSVVLPNRVGANRANIVPGNSEASPVYLKLTGRQPGSQMPPSGPLSSAQINQIKTWIDEGADWPDALSGDGVAPPPNPHASQLMEALRNGQTQRATQLLRQHPQAANATGPYGATPLMYAAFYGPATAVKALLDAGADPNQKNAAKATALMYAADDPKAARLLLEHGADPNAMSDDGQTPLFAAIGVQSTSGTVVKLLLEHFANPSQPDSIGRLPLSAAAIRADRNAVDLLLSHGANPQPTPLTQAVRSGCLPCFDILLKFATQREITGSLADAVRHHDPHLIQTLLDRGATVEADILPALALSDEALPASLVETLTLRANSINALNTINALGTVLDLAKRQGDTPLVRLLTTAGAKESSPGVTPTAAPVPTPQPAASARAAIERSIPLLQHADVVFLSKSGCVSCHNNSLTAMSMAAARKKGFTIDERIARQQLQAIAAYLASNRELAVQGAGAAGQFDAANYTLVGMAAENYKPDATTDVWARYLKNTQQANGRWRTVGSKRPPLEASEIQVTATSMRALQAYGLRTRRADYERSITLAAQWLETAQPVANEDRAFQLLGLQWAHRNRAVIAKFAAELIAKQRPDGGWSQLSTLASDAYATGQALVALYEAGALSASSAAYQRGVQFLLRSQLKDGSWYVRTRTLPAQRYFDSEFPHGPDQFISAAATNWAVMALVPAVR